MFTFAAKSRDDHADSWDVIKFRYERVELPSRWQIWWLVKAIMPIWP